MHNCMLQHLLTMTGRCLKISLAENNESFMSQIYKKLDVIYSFNHDCNNNDDFPGTPPVVLSLSWLYKGSLGANVLHMEFRGTFLNSWSV